MNNVRIFEPMISKIELTEQQKDFCFKLRMFKGVISSVWLEMDLTNNVGRLEVIGYKSDKDSYYNEIDELVFAYNGEFTIKEGAFVNQVVDWCIENKIDCRINTNQFHFSNE